jgi:hypothetical protein
VRSTQMASGSSPIAEVAEGRVVARKIDLWAIKGAEWDAFAKACGCSVKATRGHSAAWLLKNFIRYKLCLLELFEREAGGLRKIGQCAIGVSANGASFFLDRIQILPDDQSKWPAAMQAILAELGPGEYGYGWELNLEPPRDEDLAAIPGIAIRNSTPLVVQAIDFSKWDSWDAYYRDLRKGARQSAQFAVRDIPGLNFVTWSGRRSVLAVPALTRLKVSLSKRKNLSLRIMDLLTSYLGWTIICPRYTVTRLARDGGRVLAAYYGAEFGANFYYLEAASVQGNQGASWALLLSMIQRSYERDPKGVFIMGYVNYALHEEEVSGGLLRSRTACRVTDFPTSVVRFDYAPAA